MSDISNRKRILQKIPNGLFIVTAWDGHQPSAAVISFLTQTSIDPPMITVGIREKSRLYNAAVQSRKMAVHFLRKDQQDLAASFFKIKNQSKTKINNHPFTLSTRINPIITDCPMVMEVEVTKIVKGGDHHIFICDVVSTTIFEDAETLSMSDTNWHYGG